MTKKKYNRRDFLKTLSFAAVGIGMSSLDVVAGMYSDDMFNSKWYFTLDEMKDIYEKEYGEGKHLKNYVTSDCVATVDGKKGKVSGEFINTTLKHLDDMLVKDWARYIFRLDAFHSHLFLKDDVRENYLHLSDIDLVKAYTQEKRLGALYHNTEHLALRSPPETGEIDMEAKELISKRSVLGWYNGNPLEQTHPNLSSAQKRIESNTASVPEGYSNIGNLTFKAHKNGVFKIRPFSEEIRLDFSFDDVSYY